MHRKVLPAAERVKAYFASAAPNLEEFSMDSKTQRKIEPELLGMADAEQMTGRSRWSWRRDCYSGAVASVKIGRRLFVPISEVRRVIAESTRPRVQQI